MKQRLIAFAISFYFAISVFSIAAHAHNLDDLIRELAEDQSLDAVYLTALFNHPDFNKPGSPTTRECRQVRTHIEANVTAQTLALGTQFYQENKDIFDLVQSRDGVEHEFILSIIRRETVFGICLGDYYIVRQLFTLYEHELRGGRRQFYSRELRALLTAARQEGWSNEILLSLPGSWAGAFGYGHFIPTSFLNFAVDGNNDGTRDLFNPEDAIASIAHYLNAHGWNRDPMLSSSEYREKSSYYRERCSEVVLKYPDVRKGTALFLYNPRCTYVEKIFEYAYKYRDHTTK